jgi:hypothetical protein
MLTQPETRVAVDDRRFFAGMALGALAVVFAGFATSYYLWPITRATHYPAGQPISPSVPLIVHLHAALFSAWVLLLVTQVSLVVTSRVAVHRRLGGIAAGLIPLMVITGLLTAVRGARDGWNPGGPYPDALAFMFVGVADIAVFSGLAAAGLAWRRRPDVHKRLMLLSTLGGLMWPAITRMPIVAGRFVPMFALLSALVLAPAVHDFWRGSRVRWVSLVLGLGILATFPLRATVGNSTAWRALATWLVQ